MKEVKTIYKKTDGICYFSNKIDMTGNCYYRFWESKSHPNYKHWTKVKTKTNQ